MNEYLLLCPMTETAISINLVCSKKSIPSQKNIKIGYAAKAVMLDHLKSVKGYLTKWLKLFA